LVQGRAAEAGPGTIASATRTAMNEPRRSDLCERDFRAPDFRQPDFRQPDFGQPDFRAPDFREPGVTSMSPIGPVRFSRDAAYQ
jgi:uncharacterized protein YjbI with pentapeptide repeats